MPHPELGKVAWCISGGGAAGIHSVGQLLALMDAGVGYDALYGVSVGALTGGVLHGSGIDEVKNIWLNVNNKDVYDSNLIKSLAKLSLGSKYIFDNSPLLKLIKSKVNIAAIKSNPIPFYINATDLYGKKPFCGLASEASDLPRLMLASAAIPVCFPNTLYEGIELADGGLVSNWSLAQAVQGGADTVILLRPRREGKVVLKNLLDELLYLIMCQQSIALDREESFTKAMNKYKRNIRIVELQPEEVTTQGILDFNLGSKTKRQAIFDQDFLEAKAQIAKALS